MHKQRTATDSQQPRRVPDDFLQKSGETRRAQPYGSVSAPCRSDKRYLVQVHSASQSTRDGVSPRLLMKSVEEMMNTISLGCGRRTNSSWYSSKLVRPTFPRLKTDGVTSK